VGDWENRYATMDLAAEADIYRELGKFLLNGELYRGLKAVMWSVVERTALAEAEVEYHEVTSTTAYVRFPVTKASVPALEGAAVVIWTTTPWTIPANRAVAYGAGDRLPRRSASRRPPRAAGPSRATCSWSGPSCSRTSRPRPGS
jgi:isoleucyl-tRNA synthetase